MQITSEWRQIGFADPDIALLGVTKITDVSTLRYWFGGHMKLYFIVLYYIVLY